MLTPRFLRHLAAVLISASSFVFLGCPPEDDDDTVTPTPEPTVTPTPEPSPTPTPIPGARLIEVIGTEFDFNPSELYAEPGETLIIRLRNEGVIPHNIEFEFPGREHELEDDVIPQLSAELTFTVPTTPGDYVYYCPIGNHRQLGMEGTLRVREPMALGVQLIGSGFTHPLDMAMPDDGTGRMFIVDQDGEIWIIDATGQKLAEPFLDIRDRMVDLNESYDERGLLGLAFHPNYAMNGLFYIHYSVPPMDLPEGWDHTKIVSEWRASPSNPDRADLASERILMEIGEPQRNHNGGSLLFGPEDGYLYLTLGDGGGAGDNWMEYIGHTLELGNALDISNLLGSIIRIDVDTMEGDLPYGIPDDNPFVGGVFGRDEIYAYGFRNPFRASFDMGGDHALFVGDAGQVLWEEVSIVELGGNYGWNGLEGTHCFNVYDYANPPVLCSDFGPYGDRLTWPVIEIPNSGQRGGIGPVIIGGYVYRGDALPDQWQGMYLYGVLSRDQDIPLGALFSGTPVAADPSDLWPLRQVRVTGTASGDLEQYLLSFGQDLDGELYVLTSNNLGPTGETGRVWRLVPPTDD